MDLWMYEHAKYVKARGPGGMSPRKILNNIATILQLSHISAQF